MNKVTIDRELLERELLSVLDFSESNLRRVVDHLIDVGYTLAAAPVKQEVVMPPCPYCPELREENLTDYEIGELQGRCDMWEEVKRLNGGKPNE